MAIQRYRVDDGYYDEEGNYVDNSYWEEYDDGVPEYDFGYGDNNTGTGTDSGGFTGGESQDHDLTSNEAKIGQGYQQDELGNWYKTSPSGAYSFIGSDDKIYNFDAKKGGFFDSAGKLLTGDAAKSLGSALKKLVSTADGSLDLTKILPLLGGAYGASQSGGATRPVGYQGTIPKYTATRQAPGIGELLSGNVLFRGPDTVTANADGTKTTVPGQILNPNSASPSTGIAPAAKKVAEEAPVAKAKGGILEAGGFVIPADVVSHIGNGSSEAGLKLLAKYIGASPIKGKGDGMSDSIRTSIDGNQPARVANEEAVLRKSQVQALGGAKKLYAMMDQIRKARTGTKKQGKQIDPSKFMPGGSVGYANGGAVQSFVAGGAPADATGSESNLSNWAGKYVTDMLAKGEALSELPYEQYKGSLTADASDLQNKVSTGLNAISFPGALGDSFSSSTAPTIGDAGQPSGGGGIASNYMNPYLSSVLNPQLAEMGRQAKINNLSGIGSLTKSGAFGGGRQAIMQSEANRSLLDAQTEAIGKGYSSAYDKGMAQFNTEQGQAKDLAELMAKQGAVDRGIEAEEVAADKTLFEEARANPYKMVQFRQSLLKDLPLEAQSYSQPGTDGLTAFAQQFATINKILESLGQK